MYYILDEDNFPVYATLHEKHIWEAKNPDKVIVRQETFKDVFISTAFIGIKDIFYETVVIGNTKYDGISKTCTFLDAAKLNHRSFKELIIEEKYGKILGFFYNLFNIFKS